MSCPDGGVEIPKVIDENKDENKLEGEVPDVIEAPGAESHQQSQPDKKQTSSKRDLLEAIDGDASPEDFWSVDEARPKNTERATQKLSVNEEKIAFRVKELLLKELPALVECYCQTTVEKTAWEVIPDLAENLINREIQKIAKDTEDATGSEDAQSSRPSRPRPSEGQPHL